MDPIDISPIALMIDVRERLVRIETNLEGLPDRVTALETEAASLRQGLRTLKWVGGGIVTAVSIFGDNLLALVA